MFDWHLNEAPAASTHMLKEVIGVPEQHALLKAGSLIGESVKVKKGYYIFSMSPLFIFRCRKSVRMNKTSIMRFLRLKVLL